MRGVLVSPSAKAVSCLRRPLPVVQLYPARKLVRVADHRKFLTTHVGSLPRTEKLTQLMFAREDGEPFDPSALESQVERAVELAVARQLKAGLDIINDGEMPKPSYATYVKDRLTGFGGSGNSYVFQDLEAYPGTKTRMFDDPGRKHRKTPACNAPIRMRDLDAPKQDAQRLQRSLGERATVGLFLNAATPGVTTLFFRNEFYASHEEYLFACADALRLEYEAVVASGVTLQIDCPDLAMGRHTQYAHLDRSGFRDRMALHGRLNRALVNIPAEKVRMHVCWATIPPRITATYRSLISSTPSDGRMRSCSRRPTAPRARVDAVRDREAARGKIFVPG